MTILATRNLLRYIESETQNEICMETLKRMEWFLFFTRIQQTKHPGKRVYKGLHGYSRQPGHFFELIMPKSACLCPSSVEKRRIKEITFLLTRLNLTRFTSIYLPKRWQLKPQWLVQKNQLIKDDRDLQFTFNYDKYLRKVIDNLLILTTRNNSPIFLQTTWSSNI